MTLPTLPTNRLCLRPWTIDDGATFHELWGDPRVIWWGHSPTPKASLARLKEILDRCAAMPEGLGWWAVETRDRGAALGNAALQPAPYDDTAELGYHLMHAAWGHGYATEAAAALLRHGFCTLALPVISAVVHLENQGSHRVIERLGLCATGEIIHNGLPHLRYVLNLSDYAATVEP